MTDRAGQFLLLPGWLNSGPEHWMSRWEAASGAFTRVQQRDWNAPDRDEWGGALEAAVAAASQPPVLVAHSMGCLTVAHWAAATRQSVRGAFLVAVPDPAGPNFPVTTTGFEIVPRTLLPFPTIVVASDDDPYAGSTFSAGCARDWGATFVSIGARGHINGESGLGDWPEGRALLAELTGQAGGGDAATSSP